MNLPLEDQVALDYDSYDATLHTGLGVLVSGDPALPGCDLNWDPELEQLRCAENPIL